MCQYIQKHDDDEKVAARARWKKYPHIAAQTSISFHYIINIPTLLVTMMM
jgi:hypothetical protein